MILVSGSAGFIGSNFVLDWFAQNDEPVLGLDKLTYAGEPQPVYGEDRQIRGWLDVKDHCSAIRCALAKGRLGIYRSGFEKNHAGCAR